MKEKPNLEKDSLPPKQSTSKDTDLDDDMTGGMVMIFPKSINEELRARIEPLHLRLKLTETAAEQGDAEAQFCLGNCYCIGDGVKQDYSEAFKWFRKAAEQGDAGAQCNLGICYAEGHGIKQDYSEATKWLGKAIVQRDLKAKLALELIYIKRHGKGNVSSGQAP